MAEKLLKFLVEQAVGHLLNAVWQLKRGADLDSDVKMPKLENVNQQDLVPLYLCALGMNSGGFLKVNNKYFSLYKFDIVSHLSPLIYQLRYVFGPLLFIATWFNKI